MNEQEKYKKQLEDLVAENPEYPVDAYMFLSDGLGVAMQKKGKMGHLTGQELSEGLKETAMLLYGPMAGEVLNYWNIKETKDFGKMVYNLVEKGIWSKTEKDDINDFNDVFDLNESLAAPYRPENKNPGMGL